VGVWISRRPLGERQREWRLASEGGVGAGWLSAGWLGSAGRMHRGQGRRARRCGGDPGSYEGLGQNQVGAVRRGREAAIKARQRGKGRRRVADRIVANRVVANRSLPTGSLQPDRCRPDRGRARGGEHGSEARATSAGRNPTAGYSKAACEGPQRPPVRKTLEPRWCGGRTNCAPAREAGPRHNPHRTGARAPTGEPEPQQTARRSAAPHRAA
jgi:hypothetical protein